MIQSFNKLISLLVLILMLAACKRDVNLEFTMNGKDFPGFHSFFTLDDDDYTRLQDSVLTINLRDSLYVKVPQYKGSERGIKSREWMVNGKSVGSHLNGFIVPLKTSGFHAIQLCVNGKKEDCITKYVYVLEEKVDIELPPSPVITITTPSRDPERVASRKMKLIGTVTNISSVDQLQILLNNSVNQALVKFNDRTGEFEVHVQPLERGKNTILISAFNAADSTTKELIVNYGSSGSGASGSGSASGSGAISSTSTQAPWITVIEPADRSRVKTATVALKVHISRIADKDNITLKVNDETISDFSFTNDHLIATVRLREGSNAIYLSGSNEDGSKTKTITVNRDKGAASAELTNYAKAGLDASTYTSSCTSYGSTAFTVTIKPGQDIELQSFIVFSETCGGLKLTLSGGGQNQSVTKALVKGQSKISLGDVEFRMQSGTSYMFSGKTIGNFGGCKGESSPKLLSSATCGSIGKHEASSKLSLEQGASEVVFDINYRY